jgi:pimeloyl-ACP methyl ester carboxylesterase
MPGVPALKGRPTVVAPGALPTAREFLAITSLRERMADLKPTHERVLDASDGQTIHWEYFGDGTREAVCLFNGLAMHTKAWYPFLPQLLGEFDVVLYDYPGQGESSAEDVPVTIPGMAGYLAALLDELDLPRVHAMGISYGGFVAADFARLYPGRLHTLTLSGILLSHEKLFSMYQDLSLRFYEGGPGAFGLYTHYMYEKIFGESFVAAFADKLESMRQRFEDRYKDSIHSLVRLTLAQDPFFEALDDNLPGYRAVTAPTLIMPGAEDRVMLLPVQRKMCDIFPNSRWHPIEGSGHVVYLEKPAEFWSTLRAFCQAKRVDF